MANQTCFLLPVGNSNYMPASPDTKYSIGPTVSYFRGRVEIPEERKLVINSTTQPTLETRPSRMNEVNSDFADRSQFHQAHTVQGGLSQRA